MKSSNRVQIQTITKRDLLRFNNGEPYEHSIRGLSVKRDDDILAVAGVMHTPYLQVFSQMTDEMYKHPIIIMKTAKRLLGIMNMYDEPLYALASNKEKRSDEFLQHLGFEFINENDDGRFYKWQKQ